MIVSIKGEGGKKEESGHIIGPGILFFGGFAHNLLVLDVASTNYLVEYCELFYPKITGFSAKPGVFFQERK